MTSPIDRVDLSSLSITDLQKQKLKVLFPEVFTEGDKIDFERLKQTLGETVDSGKERFGMNWAGKADCFKTIQQPSIATLVPARDESVDFDTTENLFIEGDNLEVLKLLQKSYLGKVKMIYIDPPYNTGNDFIYPDNYSENLDTYLEYTGQIDGEGRKFSTNVDTDGRFHSKWMNMMYPRLFLAKNLLREDGVIFISIDDNEVHNLRALCNEVFGEENFISQAGWQKVYSPKNQARHLSNDYEYVLIYCKQIIGFNVGLLPRTEEMNKRYSNPDNDPRGDWKAGDLVAAGERKGGHYIVKNPISGKEYDVPSGKHWAFSEDTMKTLLAENRITFGKNGDSFPSFKQFLSEVKQGRVPSSLLSYKDYGHTDEAKKDFIKLFGEEGRTIFETLKPIRLIKNLALIGDTDSDSIILDFFAGSATTAHAVMDLNKEDGGNRKFICVQLPEPCDEKSEAFKAGYQTIAEISKERIRRAAAKIKAEQTEAQEKADLFDDGTANTVLDLGFRVFKLQKSNFKVWDANTPKDPEAIQQALELHVDHIDPQAEQEAILFELLLKSGFELTTPIQKFTLADKQVYSIAHDILLICLDKALTSEVIREMAELNPSRVICLDEGFQDNDQLKTNAVLIMKSKGVNDFRTV
ncbi:MAG: hypothetical protein RLZZ422_413 [Pseudomonadota bacterium]|jgi:adenine-specific DNA-methyltransferase